MPGSIIAGVGMYVPKRIVTNGEISTYVDTSDSWIVDRTGIKARHWASPEQATSDLAVPAAQAALGLAGMEASELDQIIVATITPDYIFPSTATLLLSKLKAINAAGFDVGAACAGWLVALSTAYGQSAIGLSQNSLVVGAETLSRVISPQDRNTYVLFGDGAGAAVLKTVDDPGVSAFYIGSDGSKSEILALRGGGSRYPSSQETIAAGLHAIQMDGKAVFKEAVNRMAESVEMVMFRAGLTNTDGSLNLKSVGLVIPHQANSRIVQAVYKRLNVPIEKQVNVVDRYSNTSAASIPIALSESWSTGRLHKDEIVVLVAFGAGLIYSAAALQWHMDDPRNVPFTQRMGEFFHVS